MHFQVKCAWPHQVEATVLSKFSLSGISELSIDLNEGELVLQPSAEMSASVLNKSDLLWLAFNKAEINIEAILG